MTFAINMNSKAAANKLDSVALEGTSMRLVKDKFSCEPDLTCKSILVGSSGAGKSSLLMRFTKAEYSPSFVSTVGVDYASVTLTQGNMVIRSSIWDTAGQDSSIVSTFFRGIHAVALCFDITDAESFDDVHKWVQRSNQYANGSVPFLLVGTKADLAHLRQVPVEAAQRLAASLDAQYIETSAKADNNVQAAFALLTERAVEQKLEQMKKTAGSTNSRTGNPQQRIQLGSGANANGAKPSTGGTTCAC